MAKPYWNPYRNEPDCIWSTASSMLLVSQSLYQLFMLDLSSRSGSRHVNLAESRRLAFAAQQQGCSSEQRQWRLKRDG